MSTMVAETAAMDERALVQAGFRYALALRHQRQDAEDLVQEACMRLYQRFGCLPDRPLLFTTIRNIHIDQYRREKLVLFEPLPDLDIGPGASADPALEADLTVAALEAPLARLRLEEREALYLSAVEEYTASEIAQLTQRSRGTILSLIHRARQKLRQALSLKAMEPEDPVPTPRSRR